MDAANPSRVLVKVDPLYFRPTEVELLIGDPTKARTNMKWECKVRFEDLVVDMMRFDLVDVLKVKAA